MATKRYKGRQFVNPLNRQIGRRTGRNIKAGKNIRVRADGFENFDDYLSESDADVTREICRLKNISEEGSRSGSSQDGGKENYSSNINLQASQKDTMEPSQPSSQSATISMTQSMLSQNSQGEPLHRSRFGWLKNKYIGRRTGKDLRANKQIRVDVNGIENFDDYLSESDASSFFSQSSHFSSPRSVRRKRRSQVLEKSQISKVQEHTTDFETGIETETENGISINTVKTADDEDRSGEHTVITVESESQRNSDTEVEHENHDNQLENLDHKNDESYYSEVESEKIESVIEEEDGGSEVGTEDHVTLTESGEKDNSKQVEIIDHESDVGDDHDSDVEEDHDSEDPVDEAEEEDTDGDEDADEILEEEEENIHEEQIDCTEKTEESSDSVNLEVSNTGTCGDLSEVEEIIEDGTKDMSKAESANKIRNYGYLANKVNDESINKSEDFGNGNTHSATNKKDTLKVVQVEEVQPLSQTGIDVVGNRSGSITKLEIRSQPNSAISFNKTKKRLSYSALELSEEGKKSRRSRIEMANKELENSSTTHKAVGDSEDIAKKQGSDSMLEKVSRSTKVDKKNDDNVSVASANSFVCLASRSKLPLTNKEYSDDDDEDICIVEEPKAVNKTASKRTKQRNKKEESVNPEKDNDISQQKVIKRPKSEQKSKKPLRSTKNRRKTTHGPNIFKTRNSVKRINGNNKVNNDTTVEIEDHRIQNDSEHVADDKDVFNISVESQSEVTVKESVINTRRRVGKAKSAVKSKKDNVKLKNRRKTVHDKITEIEDNGETDANDYRIVSENINNRTKKNKSLDSEHFKIDEDVLKSGKKGNRSRSTERLTTDSKMDKSSSESIDGGIGFHQDGNKKNSRKRNITKSATNGSQIAKNSKAELQDADENADSEVVKTRSKTRGKLRTKINKDISKVHKSPSSEDQYNISSMSDEEQAICSEDESKEMKDTDIHKSRSGKKLKNKTEISSVKSQKQPRASKHKSSTEEENTENDMSPAKKKRSTKSNTGRKARNSGRKLQKKSNRSSSEEDGNQLVSDELDQDIDEPFNVETTPCPDSVVPAPTNFGSGISFRVSRRSEMLETIKSGPGHITVDEEPIKVTMASTSGLTPCISRPGKTRKSKGRRVTICPEENVQHDISINTNDGGTPKIRAFRHSYSMLETPLPSLNSTPVHLFETTTNNTPTEEDEHLSGEDRLIIPEPAPEGLRRSKRTRVRPVDWYRGERVIFDNTKQDGPAIVGIKPSLEDTKWKKLWAEKRKKRILLNHIRKSTRAEQRDRRPARKLSIHTDLPQDLEETDEREIIVINPYTQEEDGLECIHKRDSHKPVGPHHGSPKRDDPYLITQMVDQPFMSAGILAIRPKAEKPMQLIKYCALLLHVTYGKLLARIHETRVLIETGDTFFVPIGNTYSLTNLRADTARLFYTIYKEGCQFSENSLRYQASINSPRDDEEEQEEESQ